MSFHVLILSDSHLFQSRERELFGVNTFRALKTTTDRIRERTLKPDLLVALGDLSEDGSERAYHDFHMLTGNLAESVIWVQGNHDNFDHPGYPHILNRLKTELHSGRWHFIFLNTAIRGRDEGRLNDLEINRLKHFLELHSADYVVVFMHHQPVLVGSGFIDELALDNREQFLEVVAGNRSVRAVIFGHVHQQVDKMVDGIRMLSVPATSMQFRPGSEKLDFDALRHGYRILTLLPEGRLETSVEMVEPGSVSV